MSEFLVGPVAAANADPVIRIEAAIVVLAVAGIVLRPRRGAQRVILWPRFMTIIDL